jgi:ubiquinone/menaquinone biosynthesis C-methylase UbiE
VERQPDEHGAQRLSFSGGAVNEQLIALLKRINPVQSFHPVNPRSNSGGGMTFFSQRHDLTLTRRYLSWVPSAAQENLMMDGPIKLDFSEKYDDQHAQQYLRKHKDGVGRRLSHWRDEQLARKALALAGEPGLILDLPCGAGRFWPLLAEKANRAIIGADNSESMLKIAMQAQPADVVKRVQPLHTSAFDIALPDNAVDSIFCMRLLHHIGEAEHRLAILREFERVTRDSVILSLWVDGNFKAWKRKRLEKTREQQGYQNRFVLPAATVEKEFEQAGFQIQEQLDFLPLYAMWRVYVLRKR